MGLARSRKMTARTARAKPEQARSSGDGEAKQASAGEISAAVGREACSRLFFFFFYTTGSAELARIVSNTTTFSIGLQVERACQPPVSWETFPRVYMYFMRTLISEG